MQRIIKAWLKKNHLSPDPADYYITLESFGSSTVDDIVEELKNDGMELNPATVKDVITRFNNKCIDLLLQGRNVSNGLVHMRLSIKGITYDKTWDRKRNPIHLVISQSKDLREAIADTIVEIMGEHPEPTAIYTVTDLSTGKVDGTITRRFNAEIKGTYIRVVGDDPACGIYFYNEERQEEYKLENVNIVLNDPSKILILVPEELEPRTYELRIVTQFTHGGILLKNPRTIAFSIPVTVI
jgi:hypothetical protein